jgi:hypothetical protein
MIWSEEKYMMMNKHAEYFTSNKKNMRSCHHALTDEIRDYMFSVMPVSADVLKRLPKEAIDRLLFFMGHNIKYSGVLLDKFSFCKMQIPFDRKLHYSGETAPYCGHGYNGTVIRFAEVLIEVDVSGQYDVGDEENPNIWIKRGLWALAVSVLKQYIPEYMDDQPFVKPYYYTEYYTIDYGSFSGETISSETEYHYSVNEVSEEEFMNLIT